MADPSVPILLYDSAENHAKDHDNWSVCVKSVSFNGELIPLAEFQKEYSAKKGKKATCYCKRMENALSKQISYLFANIGKLYIPNHIFK